MKFLHTSDIHYGAAPDLGRPWSKERAEAIKITFARMLEVCKDEKIDCLLISGGLFDTQPLAEDIIQVDKAFKALPNTMVYIIAGEDEGIIPNTPLADHKWSSNVCFIKSTDPQVVYSDYLRTSIVACSSKKGEIPESFTTTVPEGPSILMASMKDAREELLPEGYAYIALGGGHKNLVMRDGSAACCSSPEPLGSMDTGKRGFYIGEINTETGKLTALKFLKIATLRYINLVVNVTPLSSCEEVCENLKRELAQRGDDNIYTIKLRGKCDPGIQRDLSSLKTRFRILNVIDETEPGYDYVSLFRDHPSDMVGFFIQELNKKDNTVLQKKALGYGVEALLKTAGERE